MITEITLDSAGIAGDYLQKAIDALDDTEMELEDTLEQYDTLMYGDVPADPEQEDKGQVVADLLWDVRDLYTEATNLRDRILDLVESIEKALS